MILPGAILGILGGGQLGRMFAIEARRMGFRVAVLAPEPGGPANQVCDDEVIAHYDDVDRVATFAKRVDVVTFEFENVPATAAEICARHTLVRPNYEALFETQNRLREKRMLRALGLPVADFEAIESSADLTRVVESWGDRAGILKTASSGYDGKGQSRISGASEIPRGFNVPLVLEALVPFTAELSIVGARGPSGEVALFEPTRNDHVDHILDVSTCPAGVSTKTTKAAQEIARTVLEGLDYVGVLCVELFLLDNGDLIVNEIAPRPHNSGHGTLDSHLCSQFEQQVRAVCGLPLGSTARAVPAAAMANLLGDLWTSGEPKWAAALAVPSVRVHLYGKAGAREGRKMGHLTASADSADAARDLVVRARAAL